MLGSLTEYRQDDNIPASMWLLFTHPPVNGFDTVGPETRPAGRKTDCHIVAHFLL
jgi:hypothetical protein